MKLLVSDADRHNPDAPALASGYGLEALLIRHSQHTRDDRAGTG